MLVLCLGLDVADEVFDEVNPRLQISTGRGSEVELPEGVQGIGWDYYAGEIQVTLDRFITPDVRADLKGTLAAPPVLAVVEVEVPWSPRSHSSTGSRTEGCP